ncbi:MAG: zinc-binding dehydrogenase [Bacilli bacterium]
MKALVLRQAGQWQAMQVEEVAMPVVGDGDVLVEVKATGLNPVDYKTATNGNKHWTYPHVLGLDVAGEIAAIGANVDGWNVGDAVVYHGDLRRSQGGFAQYARASAHTLSRIPDGVSWKDAAALPTAGYTAYQALFRKLHIQPGRSILIHAGAGGVGGFAIQLAKQHGLTVYSTASVHNHAYVAQLGADVVIDYANTDWVTDILARTNGRGVDYVLDAVSRDNATRSLAVLAFNGGLAHIAGAPDMSVVPPFTKALSVHEIALGAVYASTNIEEQRDLAVMGDALLQSVKNGTLSPLVEEVIPLQDVPGALERLAERHVRGKIVVDLSL